MSKKYTSGIVHLLPLLIVGGIFVLGLSFIKTTTRDNKVQAVLSDSDEKDSQDKNDDEQEDEQDDDNEDEREREESSDKGQGNLELNRERVELKKETKLQIHDNELEYEMEDASTGAKVKLHIKNEDKFPLSISTESGELTVTTPAGTKVVTVLPDAAIANMLRNKKISMVSSAQVLADEQTGEVEYEVEGYEDQKLLGLFKVKVGKKFRVSATTGVETELPQDLFTQLLDLVSF